MAGVSIFGHLIYINYGGTHLAETYQINLFKTLDLQLDRGNTGNIKCVMYQLYL